MTLLLGPPSSGKTTFLLALAGKLDSDLKVNFTCKVSFGCIFQFIALCIHPIWKTQICLHQFSGRVTYNGNDMDEFVPQRTAAYISQHDVHIGEMTVRETLAFAARCQGVGSRYGWSLL